MTELLQKFQDDHADMRALLASMEIELARMRDNSMEPDYYRLCETIRCFIHLPDVCHHPAENQLLDFLDERQPDLKLLTARIKNDHREIAECANRTYLLFDGAYTGHIVARSELLRSMQEFLDSQYAHMALEDEQILNSCGQYTDTSDWRLLEMKLHQHFSSSMEMKIKAEFQWLWNAPNHASVQSTATAQPYHNKFALMN